jgi:hypothetical protein
MINFIANKLRKRMIEKRVAAKLGKRFHAAFQGSQAFAKGLTPADCPHPLGSPQHEWWLVGWQIAYDKRFPNG